MAKLLISSYLFAIVAANLIITKYGIAALPFTAIVLIPFDLIARDQLHEIWIGKYLKLKMFCLVIAGSLIAYLLNKDALNIALASSVSFLIAGFIDYAVYELMSKYSKAKKMITSNLFSATIDSIMFQLIAFGQIVTNIAIEQTAYKLIGTLLWVVIFTYLLRVFRKTTIK